MAGEQTFPGYQNPHYDPSMPPGWSCKQDKPISELLAGVSRLNETLERQGGTLEKLANGLEQIKVLSERDLRREKDVDIAFEELRCHEDRLRKLESNCRMEPKIDGHTTEISGIKIKMEGMAVKVGLLVAGASLVSGVVCSCVTYYLTRPGGP